MNYRGVDGFVLAYDITDENTFHDIEMWLKYIYINHEQPESVCKLLVGTRCDLLTGQKPNSQSRTGSNVELRLQRSLSSAHSLLQVGDSTPPFRNLREVDYPTAVEYAREHNMIGAIETSAKESINVEVAFVTLAAAMLKRKWDTNQHTEQTQTTSTVVRSRLIIAVFYNHFNNWCVMVMKSNQVCM